MGFCWKVGISSLVAITLVIAEEGSKSPDNLPFQKNHILFLTSQGKLDQALYAYDQYKNREGRHDSELLEQFCQIILEKAVSTKDEEKQLISLYGASLANTSSLLDLCETAIKSPHPKVQLASIQLAGRLHEDRSAHLLFKAFSSDYLMIRMEAASYLAQKRHKLAVGYIESLMNKLPPFFHCYFCEMLAVIGSNEAMYQVKKLLHSTEILSRVAAILAIGHLQRDDLIKEIRVASTHLNPAEQEACSFALGILGDSHSVSLLEKLVKSDETEVSLSAARALIWLGKSDYQSHIINLAKKDHLFAINLLSELNDTENLLYQLCLSKNKEVKINALLGLVKKKDRRCIEFTDQILLTNKYDLAFVPHFSTGRSLMHWKMLPSLSVYSKQKQGEDLIAFSIGFREQVLADILDIDEAVFLSIARKIFDQDQNDLFPACMGMLVNRNSVEAQKLLIEKSEQLGKPFLRHYANLALMKLKVPGPYEKRVEEWVKGQKGTELVQFRPLSSKMQFESQLQFQLTPKETSALLIDTLFHFASLHEEHGIDLLLEMMKKGQSKNLPILAGLLIKALE